MSIWSKEEQDRRQQIANDTRRMIRNSVQVEDEDETSLTAQYNDYYMQISFSPLHPLLVICFARAMTFSGDWKKLNQLNLSSVLGSHVFNADVGGYSYRATLWLDQVLTPERFFEILNRCMEEAARGYNFLQTNNGSFLEKERL